MDYSIQAIGKTLDESFPISTLSRTAGVQCQCLDLVLQLFTDHFVTGISFGHTFIINKKASYVPVAIEKDVHLASFSFRFITNSFNKFTA